MFLFFFFFSFLNFKLTREITCNFSSELPLILRNVFLWGEKKWFKSERRGNDASKLWNSCDFSVFPNLPSCSLSATWSLFGTHLVTPIFDGTCSFWPVGFLLPTTFWVFPHSVLTFFSFFIYVHCSQISMAHRCAQGGSQRCVTGPKRFFEMS